MTSAPRHAERLAAFLADEDGPRTAEEVREGLKADGWSIGIATVYRLLRRGEEEGRYAAVAVPGGGLRYEPADRGHHHHFHCEACDRVYDVKGCPGRFGRLVPEGFELDDHEVLLHGRCATCVEGVTA